jgi:hypothetical protein
MCLRAPGGSKGPPVTHGGLRAWGGRGAHGGAPYVAPILRAGVSAANSSYLTDGASVCLVVSEAKAKSDPV